MKGIRTLVLQDLPHVLPPKSFQNRLASSYQLSSSSQLHTSPSSGRFWSFFEFSSKEEPCRDAKKCPSSKDMVSPLLSANPIDAVRKPLSANAALAPSTLSLTPKMYGFDLKTTPISCLKIPRPLRQDNLMSLLDGNPVPRTLKWKLKGYKTLRNEQAGDFAFVPGGKTCDFDILSRTDCSELLNEANGVTKAVAKQQKVALPKLENVDKKDTLCLTAKAIENKEKAGCVNKLELGKLDVGKNEVSKMESSNLPALLEAPKPIPEMPKLLASSLPKKEDIQFLPVSKAELPAIPMKSQAQPSVRYSSQPRRPSSPSSATTLTRGHSPANRQQESSMESYEDSQQAPKYVEQQAASEQSTSHENYTPEVAEEAGQEWSATEKLVAEPQLTEQRPPSHQLPPKAPQTRLDSGQAKSDRRLARKTLNIESQPIDTQLETSTYFAPRPFKRAKSLVRRDSSRPDYESIIGIPKQGLELNISRPGESRPTRSSPCAATQARLLQSTGTPVDPPEYAGGSVGSAGSGSMAGSSGGGSRKPPAAYPPITSRRSSSNSSCVNDSPFARRNENLSRTALSKNSASNISTSSVNPSRRCSDGDDRCSRNTCGRRKCERERPKCERERPKCKERPRKDKKICKRYCCPALQTPIDCDYTKFQCPKDPPNPNVRMPEIKRDKTCLPQEKKGKKKDRSREICTSPTRRRDCDRDRDRSCRRERRECSRERSCDRQQSCQRQRRPCKRQDREQEEGGREICTKPRKPRDTCKRERRCDDQCDQRRNQKCSGRRNYTQSAYAERPKQVAANVKRFSSLPAFAVPLIGVRANAERQPSLMSPSSRIRFYVKETSSAMSCKGKRSDTKCKRPAKCKKEDACAKVRGHCDGRAEGSCKERASRTKCAPPKKQDPCKARKADTCKRTTKCAHTPRKEDPCKKASKGGLMTCGKKRTEKHKKVCQSMCCEGWKKEREKACCKIRSQESQCTKKRDDKCKGSSGKRRK